MEPFRRHTGIVAPLLRADVDTDQIIPKQFLKRVERSGYGRFLFHDWRFDDRGDIREDFVLNRPPTRDASILVTGHNFGCGSSREHAAWALLEYGIRVVLAPSFADIFRDNADQNGLVTIGVAEAPLRELSRRAASDAPYELTVDLESCSLAGRGGFSADFTIDPFRRSRLLEGLDRIAMTLRHEAAISAYENRLDREGMPGAEAR